MECLFSERYEELFQDEPNWFGGDEDGNIPYNVKVLIARIMEDFREPISFHPNRYDSYTVDADALYSGMRPRHIPHPGNDRQKVGKYGSGRP